MQILIPLAGSNTFFQEDNFPYPKPLVEIKGIPMIQWVIESYQHLPGEKKFIFILNEKDCTKFHLDDTIRILTNNQGTIIPLKSSTQGAICSTLMAIDKLEKQNNLIISNGDQIIEEKLGKAIEYFQSNNFDAGVITFESVHPKWSYILKEGEEVIEAAEKRPISREAVAGVYYYKRAQGFIDAAFQALYKDSSYEGSFFISATLNELILKNKRVGSFRIENQFYHSFYSPQKILEFEVSRLKT